jgi:integrase
MLDYYTGMRHAEILKLRWSQVDLKKGLIRLETTDTKNEEDRLVPLNEALTAVLKDAMSSAVHCASGLVFHRNGQPVKSIRRTFASVCRDTGLTDFNLHDFRHTTVTTMRRARIDLLTIMQITGHKTMAAFRRYNSFNEDDLRQAFARQYQIITNLAQPDVSSGMQLRK